MKTLVVVVALVSTVTVGVLLAQTQAEMPQPAKLTPKVPLPQHFEEDPNGPHRTFQSLKVAHAAYTADFAEKPGFGSSRMMFLPGQDYVTVAGATYRFSTPELVGLENKAVVYRRSGGIETISVAVMSKAELRSRLSRRLLTTVESNAVVELRAGKDLVTSKEQVPLYALNGAPAGHTTGIRAIGALRAEENCAHCHGVPKGTLLGAFSYSLTPTNLVAMATPKTGNPVAPKAPKLRSVPTPGSTNLNFTLSPNTKKALEGSLASVSGR